MASDFIPRGAAEALAYYTTVLKALAADPAAYGVEAGAVALLQTRVSELQETLLGLAQLEAEHASEVQRKTELRAAIESGLRVLVRQIQANPAITAEVKAQAAIPIHRPATSRSAPLLPTGLLVTPSTNGVNDLVWKRAGNPRGTHFVIEARTGTEAGFTVLDVVTATRYSHAGHPVGTAIVYRVRARRARRLSSPGNEAGIYL